MSDHVTLGRYKIIDELGRGGSGIVYRAIDTNENRTVALKIMHPRLINEPEFIERFRQEAELSATLKNKHLVPTYDHGEIDGRLYISMELMDGGSLKTRISQNGPYIPQDAIEVIHQICIGLNEIHALDIIHRDLKPGNILFDKDDNVKISDLGFAKILDAATSLSKTGEVIGTPSYMSPEIWRSGKITAKADIYSLACIIVEMLTANVLFDGESTPEIMLQHYQPAKLPYDLPTNWRTSLIKALAIEPNQRHETVMELYEELKKASSSSYQDEPKTGWKARPVIGSEPPTPLPSRPLFGHGTPAPAGFTAPQASPKAPSAPNEQMPGTSTQPAQEQAKAPTLPKTTSASSTSNTQIPIFRPIERPSQKTSLTPGKQASSSQPVSSAVPIFQPARSGNTPKPTVPPPLPAQFVAKPATEHFPPPKSSPLKKQSDALPPPPKPDEAKLSLQKHKKLSRRELRKQERAATKQSFKPLFPSKPDGIPDIESQLSNEEKVKLREKAKKRVLVETVTPEKKKKNRINLILGFIATLLLIGVIIMVAEIWDVNFFKQVSPTNTPVPTKTLSANTKTATVKNAWSLAESYHAVPDISSVASIKHYPGDNKLETFSPKADFNYANFFLKLRFHNPNQLYPNENWQQIIAFRHQAANDQYRLVIKPHSQSWELSRFTGSVNSKVIIASGTSTSIKKDAGKNNLVELLAIDETAYLKINGIFIETLDISGQSKPGNIWFAEQYYEDKREGYISTITNISLSVP